MQTGDRIENTQLPGQKQINRAGISPFFNLLLMPS
jgi:hypothetical protein